MKRYVISISGSSGSGKTSLVNELAKLFDNDAVTLFFDAYQEKTNYPDDMMERLSQRKFVDPKEIKCEDFYKDILKLKFGEEITDPWGRKLISKKYIIIEEPFGRLREHMIDIIDFVAFIDISLDIALARRILRDIQVEYKDLDAIQKISIIEHFLQAYMNGLGYGYSLVNNAKESADIIVNGLNKIQDISLDIYNAIKNLNY